MSDNRRNEHASNAISDSASSAANKTSSGLHTAAAKTSEGISRAADSVGAHQLSKSAAKTEARQDLLADQQAKTASIQAEKARVETHKATEPRHEEDPGFFANMKAKVAGALDSASQSLQDSNERK